MIKRFLFIFITLSISIVQAASIRWEKIAPGLQYARVSSAKNSWFGNIHAFRFKLKDYRLSLIFAKDYKRQHASVQYLGRQSKALIATNGGFFGPDAKPLGLRIQNGVMREKLKKTSWWGVFYTLNERGYIVSQRQFRKKRQINFAVQGGPRLIINGRIPTLRNGKADRTAIGITKDNHIILVVTDNLPLSTTELAQLMKRSNQNGGLECVNALNLDGGHSSQLYANVGEFFLEVANLSSVTDAVIVTRRLDI